MERRGPGAHSDGGFAPGAIVADVARQFEVSTSLVYKWREQAMTETAKRKAA